MYDLSWRVAVIVTIQFAVGYGFLQLAQLTSERITQPVGRALLSWPCYAISFIFMSSAALTMLWNMVGPIVMWIWGIVKNL